jgi:hypothetical protein
MTRLLVSTQGVRVLAAALVISTSSLATLPARADIGNAGLSAAAFLATPPGAAAPGMAGTTLALEGDLAAGSFNPASLGRISRFELALSHSEMPDGSRLEWASLGGGLGPLSTRWALSGLFAGQGTFDGRDVLNQPTSDFTASSFAVGLAIAQPLSRFASLGIGVKSVNEILGTVRGTGLAFDAGLIARAGPVAFGASARNVGGKLNYGGVGYSFPVDYGVGASFEHSSGLRLEVDAHFPLDYYNDVRGGVEYRWHERFALRAGYRHELGSDATTEPLNGPSFGLGAGLGGVWLDYAYLPSDAGATEQRLGVVLRFAAPGWRGRELGVKHAPAAVEPTAGAR